MKHKVKDLDGALLDAAVAMALGWPLLEGDTDSGGPLAKLSPSTDWAIGGPILERERIATVSGDRAGTAWFASVGAWMSHDLVVGKHSAEGPTPLIAAMRAFVVSRFGEEVELP